MQATLRYDGTLGHGVPFFDGPAFPLALALFFGIDSHDSSVLPLTLSQRDERPALHPTTLPTNQLHAIMARSFTRVISQFRLPAAVAATK
jgi:hypothetical protein